MKFTIEVLGAGNASLFRTEFELISPKRAQVRAQELVSRFANRGAIASRVLNPHGEEIFRYA